MGPTASMPSDNGAYDAILERQLQSELQSQARTQNAVARVKTSKKRSHDSDGAAESAKKKHKKKNRTVHDLADGVDQFSGSGEPLLKKKKHRSKSLGAAGSTEPRDDVEHGRNPLRDITTSGNGPLVELVVGDQSGFTKFGDAPIASQDKISTKSPFSNQQPARSSSIKVTPVGSRSEALMRTVLNACTGTKMNDSAGPEKTESVSARESSPRPGAKTESTSRVVKADQTPKKRRTDSNRYSLVPILPQGYKIGPQSEKKRHPCPVDTCGTSFTRSTGLGQHMHRRHGGEILDDNGDGTFSVIAKEEEAKRLRQASSMTNEDTPGPVETTLPVSKGHPLPRIRSVTEDISNTANTLPKVNRRKSMSESADFKRLETKNGLAIANGNAVQQKPVKKLFAVKPEMFDSTSSNDDSSEGEPLAITRVQLFPSSVSSVKVSRIAPSSVPSVKGPRVVPSSVSSVKASRTVPSTSGKSTGQQRNGRSELNSSDEELTATGQWHQISSTLVSPNFTREVQSKPKLSTLEHRSSAGEVGRREDLGSVMEDWEMSDGRIVEKAQVAGADSREINRSILAFSCKHINERKSVWVNNDISFQIQHLLGGESHLWSDDKHYLRVCSVASGKVQVIMGNEIFSIGAHGMWKIPAGERCSASNRNYAEAVIHVSSFLED